MSLFSSFLSLAIFAGSVTDSGHRRIFLLAPDSSDSRLREQQNIFRVDVAGLKERDILVTVVTRASDPKLFQTLNPEGDHFLFVLYGRDGGRKFTAQKPVSLYQLYGIIDSMPMRIEEMKRRE